MQRSRLAVLIVSTLFAWSFCVASSQATGWISGPTFTEDGFVYSADVAVDADGVSNVAWYEGQETQSMYFQRHAADGTLGPKLKLGSGGFAAVETAADKSAVAWMEGPQAPGVGYKPMISWIGPDGVISTRAAAAAGNIAGPPLLALQPNGDAVIAWADDESDGIAQLHVRQVSPDGQTGPIVDLGQTALEWDDGIGALAFTSDGNAFLAWQKPDSPDVDGNATKIARFKSTGQLDVAEVVSGTSFSSNPQITAGPGGAIATWLELDNDDSSRLYAARLSPTGSVKGTSQLITDGIRSLIPKTTAAQIAADGSATIAYGKELTPTSAAIYFRRFGQGGTLGPEVQLSEPVASAPYAAWPMLAPGRGGSTVAVWAQAALTPGSETKISSRLIAEDGTVSPREADIPGIGYLVRPPVLAGNGSGEVALIWINVIPPTDPGQTVATRLDSAFFDSAPPVVTPTIPTKLVRGVDGSMSVEATDASGIAGIEWDFGDGSGAKGDAVKHAYARAGRYDVTVTVTDGIGNEAVVSRTITVREPPVSARLKLTTVLRKKSKVSISGKINRLSSGKVALTWKQKAGKKTVAVRGKAKIRKGTFKATIKLKGKLAKSRAAGRLTAAYGGNDATRPASVSRTVKASK